MQISLQRKILFSTVNAVAIPGLLEGIARVAREVSAPRIDLIGPRVRSGGEGGHLFLDPVHASPSRCRVAAEAISDAIRAALEPANLR